MAQTTITGAMTDTDGTAWALAGYSWRLITPNGVPAIDESTGSPAPIGGNGSLDVDGVINTTVPDCSRLLPGGCQIEIAVQPLASVAPSAFRVRTQGASQSVAHIFTAIRFPLDGDSFGYADNQVSPAPSNKNVGYYVQTPSGALRVWNGSQFVTDSMGGGGGGTTIPNYGVPGAIGNGTTDDSTAVSNAAAAHKELWLPEGMRYFIGTSITINGDLRFISGAQFIIGTGITVNINGQVSAPLVQCFVLQGTGILNLGPKNSMVPAEWFGAVGDWNGSAGTDNTTAMQHCLNAISAGQMLLQATQYMVSGTLNITRSNVGIKGTSYGLRSNSSFGSPQLAVNAPSSYIVSTSSTAHLITCLGTSTVPISWNKFEDFGTSRTVQFSAGTPAGLLFQYCGGFIVENVWMSDHAIGFFFNGSGSLGTGRVENCAASFGYGSLTPSGTIYGFYIDGTSVGNASFRLRNSFAVVNGGSPTSYGLFVVGGDLEDLMVEAFETAGVSYGVFLESQSSSTYPYPNSDIHLRACIHDQYKIAAVTIKNLSGPASSVEIDGGWYVSGITGAVGINITQSSGITIQNVILANAGGSPGSQFGILAANSDNIAIVGCNFFNHVSSAVSFSTCSACTITGNTMRSPNGTATFVSLVSSSRCGVVSNPLSGSGTYGILFDSASTDNYLLGSAMVNPTSITTPVFNGGTANIIT